MTDENTLDPTKQYRIRGLDDKYEMFTIERDATGDSIQLQNLIAVLEKDCVIRYSQTGKPVTHDIPISKALFQAQSDVAKTLLEDVDQEGVLFIQEDATVENFRLFIDAIYNNIKIYDDFLENAMILLDLFIKYCPGKPHLYKIYIKYLKDVYKHAALETELKIYRFTCKYVSGELADFPSRVTKELMKKMPRLLQKDEFKTLEKDVIIEFDSESEPQQQFEAHSLVLAATSDVLKEELKSSVGSNLKFPSKINGQYISKEAYEMVIKRCYDPNFRFDTSTMAPLIMQLMLIGRKFQFRFWKPRYLDPHRYSQENMDDFLLTFISNENWKHFLSASFVNKLPISDEFHVGVISYFHRHRKYIHMLLPCTASRDVTIEMDEGSSSIQITKAHSFFLAKASKKFRNLMNEDNSRIKTLKVNSVIDGITINPITYKKIILECSWSKKYWSSSRFDASTFNLIPQFLLVAKAYEFNFTSSSGNSNISIYDVLMKSVSIENCADFYKACKSIPDEELRTRASAYILKNIEKVDLSKFDKDVRVEYDRPEPISNRTRSSSSSSSSSSRNANASTNPANIIYEGYSFILSEISKVFKQEINEKVLNGENVKVPNKIGGHEINEEVYNMLFEFCDAATRSGSLTMKKEIINKETLSSFLIVDKKYMFELKAWGYSRKINMSQALSTKITQNNLSIFLSACYLNGKELVSIEFKDRIFSYMNANRRCFDGLELSTLPVPRSVLGEIIETVKWSTSKKRKRFC